MPRAGRPEKARVSGVPLFRRHSRGVVLTSAGERLLPYAIKIAQLLKDAANVVDDKTTPAAVCKSALSNLPPASACRRFYPPTGRSLRK
jgi:DNA-binding transcriptional LysR family regulator